MDYAIFNVGYTFRKNVLNFSNFVTKFKYREIYIIQILKFQKKIRNKNNSLFIWYISIYFLLLCMYIIFMNFK